jgi:hypothetical protein
MVSPYVLKARMGLFYPIIIIAIEAKASMVSPYVLKARMGLFYPIIIIAIEA